jgi:hypothetical protein
VKSSTNARHMAQAIRFVGSIIFSCPLFIAVSDLKSRDQKTSNSRLGGTQHHENQPQLPPNDLRRAGHGYAPSYAPYPWPNNVKYYAHLTNFV